MASKVRSTDRVSVVADYILKHPQLTRAQKKFYQSTANRDENINKIAKAITHFIFRNGPVEDMHTNKQLSQNDMKTLNKFMVNRLAYVIDLLLSEKWVEFGLFVDFHKYTGTEWDTAEKDSGDIPLLIEKMVEKLQSGETGFWPYL